MRPSKSVNKQPPKVFAKAAAPAARARQAGISPGLFYGVFTTLFATNVLTAVALLMAPDIAALFSGRTGLVVSAYEDRIAQLRVEVDRLHSRSFAQAGDLNLQLQELTQQQEVLLEQQELVRQLARKAQDMGLVPASITAAEAADAVAGVAPTPALLGYVQNTHTPGLDEIGTSMDEMIEESRLALAGLAESAAASTEAIVGELRDLGIRTNLPNATGAVGGPLLPARTGHAESMVSDANDVLLALARYQAAKDAVAQAPVHRPVLGSIRTSSGFGNRRDPFSGGRAFHSGLDFPAPTGTVVTSAGPGKVTFAGQRSGYGNLVEVTHADGLVTRYGHLSAFIARKGDWVKQGTAIAKVGSTGRSTGPHLHFEVRRLDKPLDPARFLAAGQRLQRLVGS